MNPEELGLNEYNLRGVCSLAVLGVLVAGLTFLPDARAQSGGQIAAQSAARSTGQGKLQASGREVPLVRPSTIQPGQETFSSAMEATHALVGALQSDDQQALLKVLGPDAKDIISSGDDVADKNDWEQFLEKYQEMHRVVNEPDGTTTLYIGAENWPTPIPLMRMGNKWYFDVPAGKQEVLYRRVGQNELTVIQVCHELVDAEKEYYAKPHDGEPAHQYAQKFLSDPGKHNGLYWETTTGEAESPIGPLVAAAEGEGYTAVSTQKPQPFHGYYFRILNGQGAVTSKAARSYLVGGKMTGGFAIAAYPAEYRSSGVMTFIVNDSGVVYEKDLGHDTAEQAKMIKQYDRDASWHKAD